MGTMKDSTDKLGNYQNGSAKPLFSAPKKTGEKKKNHSPMWKVVLFKLWSIGESNS